MKKSTVYFTKSITPESVVKIYDTLGVKLSGKVAVKLHSGEKGNQNFIKPEFVKTIVHYVNGTVVECNTAYGGARNSTQKHKQLMADHGWTNYFAVDKACIDLIYNSTDKGRDHLVERIESRNGMHTIDAAAQLGFGTTEYELISID